MAKLPPNLAHEIVRFVKHLEKGWMLAPTDSASLAKLLLSLEADRRRAVLDLEAAVRVADMAREEAKKLAAEHAKRMSAQRARLAALQKRMNTVIAKVGDLSDDLKTLIEDSKQ